MCVCTCVRVCVCVCVFCWAYRQGGRSIVDLMRPFLDACGLDVPSSFSVRVRADMKLAYGHVVPEEAAESVAASGMFFCCSSFYFCYNSSLCILARSPLPSQYRTGHAFRFFSPV